MNPPLVGQRIDIMDKGKNSEILYNAVTDIRVTQFKSRFLPNPSDVEDILSDSVINPVMDVNRLTVSSIFF